MGQDASHTFRPLQYPLQLGSLIHSISFESQASTLVVEGVVDRLTKTWKIKDLSFSQYQITPIKWFKGSSSAPILVDQTGIPEFFRSHPGLETDDPPLQVGQTYIFFLVPSGLNDQAYFPINGPQGRYIVANGRVYSLDQQYPQIRGETIAQKGIFVSDFYSELK